MKLLNWLKKKFIRTEYIYYDVVKEGIPISPGEVFQSANLYIKNDGKHTVYVGKHPNEVEYVSKKITNVKGVCIDG